MPYGGYGAAYGRYLVGMGYTGSYSGFHIYINGIDYSGMYQVGTFNREHELNSRSTAQFGLCDTSNLPPGTRPQEGNIVYVKVGDVRRFGGTIDKISYEVSPDGSTQFMKVECVDFGQIPDRILIAKNYETASQTVRSIVVNLVQYLATEYFMSMVPDSGPTISKAIFNYNTISQCLDELANIAGMVWFVDYHRLLWFVGRDFLKAPFSITDAYQPYRNFTHSRSREKYRNRQYLRAGREISDTQTETFAGDGETKTFTVALGIAEAPVVLVNGVAKTVGIRNVDTGHEWYWAKNDKQVTQDNSGTKLTGSDILTVQFKGFYPIMLTIDLPAEISSRQAIETGSGLYEQMESDEKIDSSTMAEEKAVGFLAKFGQIDDVISFETFEEGFAPGQILTVDLTDEHLDADFLITNVACQEVIPTSTGALFKYTVKATSGKFLDNWVNFFKRLADIGTQYSIRENDVLLMSKRNPETILVSETDPVTTDPLDDGSNDPYSCAQCWHREASPTPVEYLVGKSNCGKSRP